MSSEGRFVLRFRNLDEETLFWETHSSMDYVGVEVDPETLEPIGVRVQWLQEYDGLTKVELAANMFVWASTEVEMETTVSVFNPSQQPQWYEYART